MGILSSLTRTLGGGGRRSSRPTIGAHIGRSPGFGRQARSQGRRSSGLGGALVGTLGIVVVALVLDGLLVLLGRLTISKGLRA